MPIYVYECPSCKRQIELVQKITDDTKVKCAKPGCIEKQIEMERIISTGTSFILKGSCWAKDGYK